MELKLFLAWLTTAGAAWLTYKLIDEVPALKELGPKAKRRAAYVLSAVIAILAYLAQMPFGFVAVPAGWQAWAQALFLVGTSAFGLATIIHGESDLPAERPAEGVIL